MAGCLFALMLLLTAGVSKAAEGEYLGCVALRATLQYPKAHGHADLVEFPRHGELSLARFSGLPRREAYFAWLLPNPKDTSKALIGGAFPGEEGQFSGSLIVPGGHPTSERNLRAAEKVVLTSMSLRRGRRISRRFKADHFQKPHPIRGTVTAKGGVQPPRGFRCSG